MNCKHSGEITICMQKASFFFSFFAICAKRLYQLNAQLSTPGLLWFLCFLKIEDKRKKQKHGILKTKLSYYNDKVAHFEFLSNVIHHDTCLNVTSICTYAATYGVILFYQCVSDDVRQRMHQNWSGNRHVLCKQGQSKWWATKLARFWLFSLPQIISRSSTHL